MAKEKQENPEQKQDVNVAQMTADEEAQAQAELIKEHNLRFYTDGCEVPADAIKPIKAGRLKGMSDVNPMWRMKRMTEIFGPVGFGWRYEIEKMWSEEFVLEEINEITEGLAPVRPDFDETGRQLTPAFPAQPRIEKKTRRYETKCFCNVLLFVRDPETKEWSAPIPGSGGSAIVSQERNGAYVNDEGYKMALTDALSIAMKPLGIGGNIWYGPKATGHNESKYESYTRDAQTQQNGQQSNQQGASAVAFTGAQLNQSIQEMNATTTEAEFEACWDKWAKAIPALAQQGTDFYKAACVKINALKNPSK